LRNAASQTGVAPAQSLLARQPTHVFVAGLQSGVAPPQVAFVTHATHVAVPVSQAGVAPPQWDALPAEHSPQAPLPRHTGRVAGHSASEAHARHACELGSQRGVVPAQFVSARQPTQTWGVTVVRQYGVAPEQSELCAHPSIVTGVGAGFDPLPLPSDL
jgi:hypothetical protein